MHFSYSIKEVGYCGQSALHLTVANTPDQSFSNQWRDQPKNLGAKNVGGAKMFDFRRITIFCLEKRVSRHKMTVFSKNLGGHDPFAPPLTTPMSQTMEM